MYIEIVMVELVEFYEQLNSPSMSFIAYAELELEIIN